MPPISRELMTFIDEIRSRPWNSVRALLIGWGLWIFALVWFFPFISQYFFVYRAPKPYPVTSPFADPNFYVRGLDVSFSLNDPLGSAVSVLWLPIAAPRGISEKGLADPWTFTFGIVLPFFIAVLCGFVVALLQRKQGRTSALLFSASILLVNLLFFARHVAIVGASAAASFAGALSLYVLVSATGILLGGELAQLASGTRDERV
jgi:hypothetical protein